MKPDEIEVKKIEISIAGKTLSLKPEQAKELKRILCDMFGEDSNHHYWWHYYPTYTYPYSVTPAWRVTYGDNLTGTSGSLSNSAASDTIYLTAT